jgi:hypothetical protein
MAGNANDVTHIEQLKETEGSLADGVELYVNLEPSAISLYMREAGFAVEPEGQDATGRAHIYTLAFEVGRIALGVSGYDLSRRRRLLELMRVGVLAKRLDFGEFFLAL